MAKGAGGCRTAHAAPRGGAETRTNAELANEVAALDRLARLDDVAVGAREAMLAELAARAARGNEGAAEALDWLALPAEEEPRVQLADYGLRCEWRGGSRIGVVNMAIECEEDNFELDRDDPSEAEVTAAMRRYLDEQIEAARVEL